MKTPMSITDNPPNRVPDDKKATKRQGLQGFADEGIGVPGGPVSRKPRRDAPVGTRGGTDRQLS